MHGGVRLNPAPMYGEDAVEDGLDRMAWIQRTERVLEDHLHFAPERA
jgi:hypothetical protein